MTYHKPFAIVRGEKTTYTCKLVCTRIPPLQLKLIEFTEGLSAQLVHLKSKRDGTHHIQFRVKNLGKEIERYRSHGFNVLQEHRTPNGGFVYMDMVEGILFELVGPTSEDG